MFGSERIDPGSWEGALHAGICTSKLPLKTFPLGWLASRGGAGRPCRMYPELAMRKGGGGGLAELSTRHGLSQAVTQRLALIPQRWQMSVGLWVCRSALWGGQLQLGY